MNENDEKDGKHLSVEVDFEFFFLRIEHFNDV